MSADYINVVDDWIYFSGRIYTSDTQGVYKIRTNGSDRIKLTDIENDVSISNMSVVDDWVYYCVKSSYTEGINSIYKMRTDGTNKQIIESSTNSYDSLIVTDGWIYYRLGERNPREVEYNGQTFTVYDVDYLFYKTKVDVSTIQLIPIDLRGDYSHINVIGDWIYYADYNESEDDYGVYKIRIDGSEKQLLHRDSVPITSINVADDGWVYFSSNMGGYSEQRDTGILYKMRTDGTENQILSTHERDGYHNLCVVDEWIYYTLQGWEWASYWRIRTDGSGNQQLN
jgi:IS1 family transposase